MAAMAGAGTLTLNGTALTLTAGTSAYSGPIGGTWRFAHGQRRDG